MRRLRIIFALLALWAACGSWAQELGLLLRLDFTNVSGKTVTDNASGIAATLQGSAKVAEMGTYKVLSLGASSGYLDLGEAAGKLFAATDNYTVSAYHFVPSSQDITGAGNFAWTFSTHTACESATGKYASYRVNAQRFAVTTAGYGSEVGVEVGSASTKGKWVSTVVTVSAGTATLYVDGIKMGTVTNVPKNSTNFGTNYPAYNWIGRPAFASDNYLANALVYDFRLYDRALSGAEVMQLAVRTADLQAAYVHGSQGSTAAIEAKLAEAEQALAATDDYPKGAVADLNDTYTMVKAKVSTDKLSQEAIDGYLATLTTALTTYKATKGKTFDDVADEGDYDTDRGFRHPGGFHTEADFARVKAQIAAGNERVVQGYKKLISSEWSQATCATYPVETIVRGGGVGENYINAARGANIAYQNALRWKLDGTEDNAKHAVQVLNQWATTCKAIGGNSNYALAAGLYGYEFAQAAELMRDYEGWRPADFAKFKRWMLDVWYPSAIGFLRGRNGTWENSSNKPSAGWGTNGERPGHYWSNWGLCNTLAVMSIGILCDDVFIYNQGLSYYKHDQNTQGYDGNTATDIYNRGLAEYIDNLVPAVADDPLGLAGYGKLGQMQESGRDQGHATMALGLAVDICQLAWNQGDDLFSYHDNRLAAGIEFTAAYNNAGRDTLMPWANYHYADCRTAWHNAWNMTGPSSSGRGQTRTYWGTVIGHYEGVKGVRMPYAEMALEAQGVDGGVGGSTSGGYDHMGFSVLMHTHDSICPEALRPTLLTPQMEYDGQTLQQGELGGLENTYAINTNTAVPTGKTVKLMPQLPDGEEDTGLWLWNTGETTREITVSTNKSHAYRATYTNARGVKSEQLFTIAVLGDCTPTTVGSSAAADGATISGDTITVYYGTPATFTISGLSGWGTGAWDNGMTGTSITLPCVATERTVSGQFTNQGGRRGQASYHTKVKYIQPEVVVNNVSKGDTTKVVAKVNDNVALAVQVPTALAGVSYEWSDGSKASYLAIDSLKATETVTVKVKAANGIEEEISFNLLVPSDTLLYIEPANYVIRHVASCTYLTNDTANALPVFAEAKGADGWDASQVWYIYSKKRVKNTKYDIISLADSARVSAQGKMVSGTYQPFYLLPALGTSQLAIRTSTTGFWVVDADGTLNTKGEKEASDFPFEIIKADFTPTGIANVASDGQEIVATEYYTLSGVRIHKPQGRLCIVRQRTENGYRSLKLSW